MPRPLTVSVPSNTISAAQKKNAAPPKKIADWVGKIAVAEKSRDATFTLDQAVASIEQFARVFVESETYLDSIGMSMAKTRAAMQHALGAMLRLGGESPVEQIRNYSEACERFAKNIEFLAALKKRYPKMLKARLAGCSLEAHYADFETALHALGYIGAQKVNESRSLVKSSMQSASENDKKNGAKKSR